MSRSICKGDSLRQIFSKGCRCLTCAPKAALSKCNCCKSSLSCSSLDEYMSTGDYYNEQREVIVAMIRIQTQVRETKCKHRTSPVIEGFTSLRELFVAAAAAGGGQEEKAENSDEEEEEEEEEAEFLTARSRSSYSGCSNAADTETFFSVGSSFKRNESRSVMQEFSHCEGWPFGLCRKALLLPPLPKSPSEPWSWHRGMKIVSRQKKLPL